MILHSWKEEIKEFSRLDLSRQFIADDQRLPDPSEETVREILHTIGKESQMENETGCESCGYSSCREFAIAIAQGLATTDMCHIYSTQNRQEYIKSLRAANEKLASTQAALKESEEKTKHEQETEKEASETMSATLQKLVSGVVIIDENLKIVQSNKAFIRILGEDAALVDEVIPGLIGADLKSLLPVNFYKLFSYVLTSDEEIVNKDIQYGETTLECIHLPDQEKQICRGNPSRYVYSGSQERTNSPTAYRGHRREFRNGSEDNLPVRRRSSQD